MNKFICEDIIDYGLSDEAREYFGSIFYESALLVGINPNNYSILFEFKQVNWGRNEWIVFDILIDNILIGQINLMFSNEMTATEHGDKHTDLYCIQFTFIKNLFLMYESTIYDKNISTLIRSIDIQHWMMPERVFSYSVSFFLKCEKNEENIGFVISEHGFNILVPMISKTNKQTSDTVRWPKGKIKYQDVFIYLLYLYYPEIFNEIFPELDGVYHPSTSNDIIICIDDKILIAESLLL